MNTPVNLNFCAEPQSIDWFKLILSIIPSFDVVARVRFHAVGTVLVETAV